MTESNDQLKWETINNIDVSIQSDILINLKNTLENVKASLEEKKQNLEILKTRRL